MRIPALISGFRLCFRAMLTAKGAAALSVNFTEEFSGRTRPVFSGNFRRFCHGIKIAFVIGTERAPQAAGNKLKINQRKERC
jgi:hypothetical protein